MIYVYERLQNIKLIFNLKFFIKCMFAQQCKRFIITV